MSLERVHQYIKRHAHQMTFVCVKYCLIKGKLKPIAKCMAADDKKVGRILTGMYSDVKPVGFYTGDVIEAELAEDLRYSGVET